MSEDETSDKYVFHGVVFPERTNVEIPSTPFEIEGTYDVEGTIRIIASQIKVTIETADDIDSIETLRNMVQEMAYSQTDLFAFTHGYYYDLEITSVVLPDDTFHVFPVSIPAVHEMVDEEDERDDLREKVTRLYGVREGNYLRRSITDFRMAMQNPVDTGVFCYRAAESLRHHFKDKYDIDDEDRTEQWEQLRDDLGIDGSVTRNLESYSIPRRHGEPTSITGEERRELFEQAWEIIRAFIEYGNEEIIDD